ncbi:hypothetical protein SLNWT_7207 [Streptomyces albus]|uniref:Uncharacterized protein n=1 Tax=Streptomyces albus (strain ATCC 21838 / DSM 41398 / FERM P-419 / JCM 4703 / NBRC 107858) TaxID=1081613 RepID=A0A0B5EXP3_STRA4|nr:hypothetical protein SLNWT_7207 [Streptomyces albus]AOU81885.1 hypothetical protein SLNHY_7194 [Streptomyces albus]AYN37569.1 hypothetical protein DUI70_7077 [Streptomyces albus]
MRRVGSVGTGISEGSESSEGEKSVLHVPSSRWKSRWKER